MTVSLPVNSNHGDNSSKHRNEHKARVGSRPFAHACLTHDGSDDGRSKNLTEQDSVDFADEHVAD